MSDEEDNVVRFPGETMHDIPVEEVLSGVGDLERVMVLGWGKDGELWVSSSFAKASEMLLLLEVVKKVLLEATIYGSDS